MKFAPLTLALVLSGCAGAKPTDSPKDLLWHDVKIPTQYRSGDPWPGYDGESKRYTYAYEQAWWRCVETHAKDIDHKPDITDKIGNGWPCAVDGCWNGYSDCEIRVQQIIKRLGREAAQKVFQKALNEPERVNQGVRLPISQSRRGTATPPYSFFDSSHRAVAKQADWPAKI